MPRWNICNILHAGAAGQHLWHFDAKGNGFALNREHTAKAADALPGGVARKSWGSLFRKKLNVAWLPPENVFLKLVEIPQSSFDETLAMVELQLEKLSPIPVTQCVWTLHVMPRRAAAPDAVALQTVVVVLVERTVVEEFLGQLESRGYLADRLELPMLDQLEAANTQEDGVWIYPQLMSGQNASLVAWWIAGVLRDLSLVTLVPEGGQGESLKSQFARLAWAGELEGWLNGQPKYHLVSDAVTAALWEHPLRDSLGEPVSVEVPLPPLELAGRTAHRAAAASDRANLLPAEFTARYQQQFVDRLWLRALMAAGVLYLVIVAVYFAIVGVVGYQTGKYEAQVQAEGGSYTNALQLRARYSVLKQRDDLKFAALDCWQAIADQLPAGVSLQRMSFSDGSKLTLGGSVSSADLGKVIDFTDALRKTKVKDEPLFDATAGDPFTEHKAPGDQVAWSFGLVLKNAEDNSK